MKYSISTKKIELEGSDYKMVERKLSRIQKHVSPPYDATLVISRDSHHRKGRVISCSIKIVMGKHVFYAKRQEETLPDALDETIRAVVAELKKSKQKGITLKRKLRA
jgi:ribosome-associated translation inhibitor RaiA